MVSIQLSGKYSFHQEPINCLNSGIKGLSFFNSRHLESVIQQLKRIKGNEVVAMATSLISQPASSLSLKWQEEEISLKDTFSALASCKGDIFQEVLVWSYWNLFLGVSLFLQELCPGQSCMQHKVKRERKKKSRAGSQWVAFLHRCALPTCSGHRQDWAGQRA